MKHLLLLVTLLWILPPAAKAQEVGTQAAKAREVEVHHMALTREGQFLSVDMLLQLTDLKVNSKQAVILTPRLAKGDSLKVLPSVGIYGRQRYYYYVRQGKGMQTGPGETSFRAKDCPQVVDYHQVMAFEPWMDGATLTLHRQDLACCNTLIAQTESPLAHYAEKKEFVPQWVYLQPRAERVKQRSLEGSAFIDFPVNQTLIRPEYRRNAVELGKIRATLDSVRAEADIQITGVWLKGHASPEGPYATNAQLAQGRTEALKQYLCQVYQFEEELIATEFQAENWEGLRRFVAESAREDAAELLALIDGPLDPDAKERELRRSHPQAYRSLVQDCFPALRYTDYRIAYTLRTYSQVEEIRRVMATRPQNLSLNEFFLLAQACEPGSEDFHNVFETAVRMYPQDETANLNAAVNALRQRDLPRAKTYLDKAGNSPQTLYARGIWAFWTEDYAGAEALLEAALRGGVAEAGALQAHIQDISE